MMAIELLSAADSSGVMRGTDVSGARPGGS